MKRRFPWIFVILLLAIVVSICVFIKYANTPMGELPMWVYWLIGG